MANKKIKYVKPIMKFNPARANFEPEIQNNTSKFKTPLWADILGIALVLLSIFGAILYLLVK